MLEAVKLARRGLFTAHPNPRVGCLLVKDDQIIGRGWHKRAGLGHAEVEALADCKTDPQGATVYVTLEPCSIHAKTPPCTDALLQAGVAKVIIGTTDPNPKVASMQMLRDAGIEVLTGCEEAACVALNPGFNSRMQNNRPFVRVKMAMSLDGRTALANGVSQWITGREAREDVQFWRAQSDCILTGIGTVLADNPALNVRVSDELFQQYGFGMPFEVVHLPVASDECRIGMQALLEDLARREINEVHVEAGATLCASLIKAQLVDELLLYIAPHLLGADARGLFALTGLESMAERCEFEFIDVQKIGPDLRLLLRPVV